MQSAPLPPTHPPPLRPHCVLGWLPSDEDSLDESKAALQEKKPLSHMKMQMQALKPA